MKKLLLLSAIAVLTLAASPCWSEVPHLINYNGMLTDDAGTPLNGNYDLTFAIYDVSAGGTPLWVENHYQVPLQDGLVNIVLGSLIAVPSYVFNESVRYLGIRVGTDSELTPRIRLTSIAYAYRSEIADTAIYAVEAVTAESDSDWTIAGDNIYRLTGNLGIGTDSPTVKLDVVGTVQVTGLKMPTGASNGYVLTSDGLGVGTWQAAPGGGGGWVDDGNAVRLETSTDSVGIGKATPSERLDVLGTVQMTGFKMPAGASNGYILTSDGSGLGTWQAATEGGSNWTLTDSVLYTNRFWGVARGGAGNMLYGDSAHTMVNLGVACSTGTNLLNYSYCSLGGGLYNAASQSYASVGGGTKNRASNSYATVGGGDRNRSGGSHAFVGGGQENSASQFFCTIGGGRQNTAGASEATIGGGYVNAASGTRSTVAGGAADSARAAYSAVGGGWKNIVTGERSTIAGGSDNTVTGLYAAIPGGYADTVAGDYSFAAGSQVRIASGANYTFAFGRNFTTSDSSAAIFYDSVNGIKVGIQTTSPQRALHIKDVLRLEPRTSAPSDPSEGDIYVNSTEHHIYCYLDGQWVQLDNSTP